MKQGRMRCTDEDSQLACKLGRHRRTSVYDDLLASEALFKCHAFHLQHCFSVEYRVLTFQVIALTTGGFLVATDESRGRTIYGQR